MDQSNALSTVCKIENESIVDLERNLDFQRKCWKALDELRSAEKQLLVIVQLSEETKALFYQIQQNNHIWANNGRPAEHTGRAS
jgi:hypothetical protein